jgi:ATP-binding cassette subfamily B protein
MKKRAPWRHERKTLNGELNGLVADAVTNSVTVKTFGKEPYEINELHKKNKRFEHLYIKDIGFVVMEGSIRVAIMAIVQIIAIAISAYLVINGRMNIATAVFILTYLQRISSQIFTLGDIINGYDRALLEAAPMSDILANPTTVNDSPNAQNVDLPHPDIHLDNVSYKYEDADDAVLHNINLMIKAGEKIGVVGHSGSGKSTLTHLLLRFSDVTGGAIKIGGHDIRDITQDSLRNHIAYVPQEPALFHRSIRDNIAYGQLSASDQDVELAAKQANALDFINKLPNGINTLVGERGVKLSGGQRQRIAIARAILKDSPILILDEATSALDSESESLIQSALAKLMKNRTTIVIAHRLSTIAKLDRIIVLDNGKISEQGTHQELIALKGTYAKLWNHQSGGFIEE